MEFLHLVLAPLIVNQLLLAPILAVKPLWSPLFTVPRLSVQLWEAAQLVFLRSHWFKRRYLEHNLWAKRGFSSLLEPGLEYLHAATL